MGQNYQHNNNQPNNQNINQPNNQKYNQSQDAKKEETYSSTKSNPININSTNSSINYNPILNANYNSSNSSVNNNPIINTNNNSTNSSISHHPSININAIPNSVINSYQNTPKKDNIIDFNGISRPRAASKEYTPKFRIPIGPDTFRNREIDTSKDSDKSYIDNEEKSKLEFLDSAFSDSNNFRPLTSSSSPNVSTSDSEEVFPVKVLSTKMNQISELSNIEEVNELPSFSSESQNTGSSGSSSMELKNVKLNDLETIRKIGKGSFGEVLLVKRKSTGVYYAMKVVMMDSSSIDALSEKNILLSIRHPLIVQLEYFIQENKSLYLGMEYIQSGSLHSLLKKYGKLPEHISQFYLAELVCVIDYLHENSIIYRDLKPENILIHNDGHIRLIDFGLAKAGVTSVDGTDEGSKAQTFCGTPQYLAPEILTGTNHGKAVDWWSLGILMYEMIVGHVPFNSSNRNHLYEQTIQSEIYFPEFVSKHVRSFIRGVLVRKPVDRLGCGSLGVLEIRQHPFFKGVRWPDFDLRRAKPPILPDSKPSIIKDKNHLTNLNVVSTASNDSNYSSNNDFPTFSHAQITLPTNLRAEASSPGPESIHSLDEFMPIISPSKNFKQKPMHHVKQSTNMDELINAISIAKADEQRNKSVSKFSHFELSAASSPNNDELKKRGSTANLDSILNSLGIN